jgi:DNA-binding MarR family transcriptional regulator
MRLAIGRDVQATVGLLHSHIVTRGMHMKPLATDGALRASTSWHRASRGDTGLAEPIRTSAPPADNLVSLIMHEQQASRLKSSCFPELRLRNPLWDLLIGLLAAKRSGQQLSMSDLCLMSDAPESTALRLIHQLREKGYAEMIPDRSDRRRTRVVLTNLAEAQFDQYLERRDQT